MNYFKKRMNVRFAEWIYQWPSIVTNFEGADGRLLSGANGQLVMWTFPEASVVPEHRHGPQIGIVVTGEVDITIGGQRRVCHSGDMFEIEDQQPHSAVLAAGTLVLEVFQENDRYPVPTADSRSGTPNSSRIGETL
jgi:quercetin dioxygenase-like cupin family protein